MDQYQRKDAIMEFRNKNCRVLVVTDLASRGIDLPHVSNVVHFDFPAQVKKTKNLKKKLKIEKKL